jgi:hypothetical protein
MYTHGRHEKCIKSCAWKTSMEETTVENLDIDGEVILTYIL